MGRHFKQPRVELYGDLSRALDEVKGTLRTVKRMRELKSAEIDAPDGPVRGDRCRPLMESHMASLSRAVRERDGSMVIETALVLPTFFLLLFGIFQISMLLVGYCSATYAVNIGARYASVNSLSSANPASMTQISNLVTANLFLPLSAQSATVNVTYGNNSSVAGNNVGGEVGVAVTVLSERVVIPFWGTKTYTLQCQSYRYIVR